jgi:anti-sigma factor ChrR (cupin superfamily)
MNPKSTSAPPFVAETLKSASDEASVERDAAALLEAWAPLSNDGPSAEGLARLNAAINDGPQRYAPFFDQLQALYQRDESFIVELLRAEAWEKSGLPGVSIRDVELGPDLKGCEGRLTLFRPGTRFPKHTHGGRERVLVLLGSLQDSVSGEIFGPGDLQEMPAGSSHGFLVGQESPCLAASVHDRPFRFDSWVLRFLGKLLGR